MHIAGYKSNQGKKWHERPNRRAKQRRIEKKRTQKLYGIRLRVNICFALHIFHRRFVFRQAENRIFVPIVERPAQRTPFFFRCSLFGLVSFEPFESCVSRNETVLKTEPLLARERELFACTRTKIVASRLICGQKKRWNGKRKGINDSTKSAARRQANETRQNQSD